MNESGQTALAHDFEVLLRYAAHEKMMLAPKQKFIPLRHVRNMMADFWVKEPHEEKGGDRIYKKRDEIEYRQFYFLDLLALSGEFLTITRAGRLAKGRNWQKFFEAPEAGRPFYLFRIFRAGFNAENWFLHRGGGFGERLEEKWSGIWSRLAEWQDGQPIDWVAWAARVIENLGLYWEAPDQAFAKKNMIWGLKYCLIEPMEYFGILELSNRSATPVIPRSFDKLRIPSGVEGLDRGIQSGFRPACQLAGRLSPE